MANSIFVDIDSNAWTQVSSSSTGLITNNGPQVAFILEAASTPSSSIENGHRLTVADYFRYRITGSQQVFARSINGAGVIVETPD